MKISKPYRFIGLSEDIEEVKKMREYNNQVILDKSTAIAVDTNEQFIFQDGKWRKMTIKMSIDEAIPILHDMYNYYNDVDVDAYVGFDNEDNNAIETALDTMRKYQKIEEIVKSKTTRVSYDIGFRQIKKVVEED